ncbi:hypothetical protein [Streptomyces sp. NPDC001744]|uniref:hypothetical protein n=1 Tax=Streptomyces sp. NPDC001744 TaxID=3364606 RepID=UPI0036B1F45F
MTSTADRADTTQHPDVSEISDLTEGLLPPSRSAAVRRHVEDCSLCGDVKTSLEEIRGLLGTLPGPPRMPAEIAGRIDAALAAEALLDAISPGEGDSAPVSRETSRPYEKATPAPSTPRSAGRPRASAGPGRPGVPRRRRIALLTAVGAAFGAVALGTSLYLGQADTATTAGVATGTKKAEAFTEAAPGTFSGSAVEDRVHDLLTGEKSPRTPQDVAPESLSSGTGTVAPRRSRDGAAPGCVLAGTGRADPVLGQERGEYRGTPAYLLVLPDPADPTRVRAYVIDASCADRPSTAGTPAAEVLLSRTYPRS